jgi:hypothetical protein
MKVYLFSCHSSLYMPLIGSSGYKVPFTIYQPDIIPRVFHDHMISLEIAIHNQSNHKPPPENSWVRLTWWKMDENADRSSSFQFSGKLKPG